VDESEARSAICRVGRQLYERGLVAGSEGNLSVRLADGRILATPAGAPKGALRESGLVLLGPEGTALDSPASAEVSSEIRMHLRVYRTRGDVGAVVHAHPPVATGFAMAGRDLMAPHHPEVIFQLGGVPLVPYAPPGTERLADVIEPYLADHDGFLLANHGATTVGASLAVAHQRMESLEQCARSELTARLLGGSVPLPTDEVERLLRARAAARTLDRPRAGEE